MTSPPAGVTTAICALPCWIPDPSLLRGSVSRMAMLLLLVPVLVLLSVLTLAGLAVLGGVRLLKSSLTQFGSDAEVVLGPNVRPVRLHPPLAAEGPDGLTTRQPA